MTASRVHGRKQSNLDPHENGVRSGNIKGSDLDIRERYENAGENCQILLKCCSEEESEEMDRICYMHRRDSECIHNFR
jgi:hypothetical protein